MRTYSGYLLIEDLLDDLPDSSATIKRIASGLINPTVKIVEEDCGTLIGKKVSLGFSHIGGLDLALDERLTRGLITSLLEAGDYYRRIRHPAYCSSKGGVCAKCAFATLMYMPTVGSQVQMFSEIVSGSFSYRGTAITNSFVLDLTEEESDRLEVFVNSTLTNNYEVSVTSDGYMRVYVPDQTGSFDVDIRAWKRTSSPFISFLSKTYSGSLLGASKMEGYDLPVRAGMLQEYTTDSRILLVEEALQEYSKNIPDGYLDYSTRIRDPLERTLYLICLYGIFNDLEA